MFLTVFFLFLMFNIFCIYSEIFKDFVKFRDTNTPVVAKKTFYLPVKVGIRQNATQFLNKVGVKPHYKVVIISFYF